METDHCRSAQLRRRVPSGPGSAHIGSLGGGLPGGGDADWCSFHTPGDLGCWIVQMFVDISSWFPPRAALVGWIESEFGGIEDLDLGWWGYRRAGGLCCGNTGC